MFFKYMEIDKDLNTNSTSTETTENNLYKLTVTNYDGTIETKEELDVPELINILSAIEESCGTSIINLLEKSKIGFASQKVEDEFLDTILKEPSKSISGQYENDAEISLGISRTDYNLCDVTIYKDGLYSSNMEIEYSYIPQLIEDYKLLHNNTHYSTKKLLRDFKINITDDRDNSKKLDSVEIMLKKPSAMKLKYLDGHERVFNTTTAFNTVIKELISRKPVGTIIDENTLKDLYEDGKLSFTIEEEITRKLKVLSITIKSNGDVIAYTPFRQKFNICNEHDKLAEFVTAMSTQTGKSIDELVEEGKIKFVYKTKKQPLPTQLVFGSVENAFGEIRYKYFVKFKNGHYEQVTKDEAVNYFNKIAKKKRVYKSADEMFDKGYCKVLPIEEVEEYLAGNNKEKSTNKNSKLRILNTIKTKVKNGFSKIKGFFNKTAAKVMAVSAAIVITCVGVVGGLFASKNNDKEDTSSNSVIDSLDSVDKVNNPSENQNPTPQEEKKEEKNCGNIRVDVKNLKIASKEYNDLLTKCTSNKYRYNAMKRVGAFYEYYNELDFVKNDSENLKHNFYGIFYQYLACNDVNGSKFNNILGQTGIDMEICKTVLEKAIAKDAMSHSIQKESTNKKFIMEDEETVKLYTKYEDLFIKLNTEEDKNIQKQVATQFYDMVREDLPNMKNASYENVAGYMYLIEEFRQAMELKDMDVPNKFNESEVAYIKGILDNVVIKNIVDANTSNHSVTLANSYLGNMYNDSVPSIEEFKKALSNPEKEKKKLPTDKDKNINNGNNDDTVILVDNDSYQEFYDYNNTYVSYTPSNNVTDNSNNITSSISTDVEVEIIDNSPSSVVEGTISKEDMEINYQDNIYLGEDTKDNEVVQDTVENNDSQVNDNKNQDNNTQTPSDSEQPTEGIISEDDMQFGDYYENYVNEVTDDKVYDKDTPLPDPNTSNITSMSNEQLASMMVEVMANANNYNSESNDYTYHLSK